MFCRVEGRHVAEGKTRSEEIGFGRSIEELLAEYRRIECEDTLQAPHHATTVATFTQVAG